MEEYSIRDEIVVLMRDGNDFVDHDRLSLSDLKNVLSNIGDRLTLHIDDAGHAVYRIEARYLIDLRSSTDAGEDARFWVLVVDQHDKITPMNSMILCGPSIAQISPPYGKVRLSHLPRPQSRKTRLRQPGSGLLDAGTKAPSAKRTRGTVGGYSI